MKITISFSLELAKMTEYNLRRYYGSKAELKDLAKVAILEISAAQAHKESDKAMKLLEKSQ